MMLLKLLHGALVTFRRGFFYTIEVLNYVKDYWTNCKYSIWSSKTI